MSRLVFQANNVQIVLNECVIYSTMEDKNRRPTEIFRKRIFHRLWTTQKICLHLIFSDLKVPLHVLGLATCNVQNTGDSVLGSVSQTLSIVLPLVHIRLKVWTNCLQYSQSATKRLNTNCVNCRHIEGSFLSFPTYAFPHHNKYA